MGPTAQPTLTAADAREIWDDRGSGEYSDAEIAEAERVLESWGWT